MNRKYLLFLSITILMVSIIACGQKEEPKVEYNTKTFKKSFEADSIGLVEFNFEIIEIDKAPTPAAKDSINKYLSLFYNASVTGEYEVNSVETLFDSTLADFKRELPSAIEMGFPYNIGVDRSILVVLNNHNLFTYSTTGYQFTGGAHGMTYLINYNFDAVSGEQISLDQLFNPGYHETVRRHAEKYFRSKNNLMPNEDLNAAGFWFENNKYEINDNFLIGKDSLSFLYNQYEIAAYAYGQFEVKIPYNDIKDIINKDGALKFVFEK
ncbi:MAG: DUF3298 and DUF4163 domain-containing protein [Melioribacteraceae bacterium]|nr:DUF3298 and DUF4163 domain-containing protein [Melioribacteraceae bacterium]